MKKISAIFLTGLVAIVPVAATFYVLFWLVVTVEGALGKVIRVLIPAEYYWPGMGVVASLAIIFTTGVLLRAWIVRKLFEWGTGLLDRIPLVKSLYGAFRDLLHFVSQSGKGAADKQQVVMVTLGGAGMEIMGFVTRHDFKGLPAGVGKQGHLAVYIPMSYQIGGHTVIVPESAVRSVDVSMEQAMRFVLSAGMMSGTSGPREDQTASSGDDRRLQ